MTPAPRAEAKMRLYLEPREAGTCRGCQAPIEWYETLRGRRMPMNAGAQPVGVQPTVVEGARAVGFFLLADAHWAACPQRAMFSLWPPRR